VFQASTVRPGRQPRYSGTPASRLSCRSCAVAIALALALAASGCSYRLGGFLGGEESQTSAVPARAAEAVSAPAEADLALAKAAVHDLMSRGGETASVPWENPRTGARGAVTPIAAAYTHDGFTCRDFLASYVRDGAESWLQGEACRLHRGKWEVKTIRPLKKT
jgi:hypothetical protein